MSSPDNKSERTISGIDVMRGVGAAQAKPFWADAWGRVVERRGAQLGILWIAIIGFFAIFAPVVANGLPLWTVELSASGEPIRSYSPIFESLTATDVLLLIGGILGPLLMLLPLKVSRQKRLGFICAAATLATVVVILVAFAQYLFADSGQDVLAWNLFPYLIVGGSGVVTLASLFWIMPVDGIPRKLVVGGVVVGAACFVCTDRWVAPVVSADSFIRGQIEGTQRNTYTLVPWSPTQSNAAFFSRRPNTTVSGAYLTVAEEQLEDGIAFFIRTVAFNLSPRIEGLPMNGEISSELVELLTIQAGLKDSSGGDEPAVEDWTNAGPSLEGVSQDFVDRFTRIGDLLGTYRRSILEEDSENATAAAKEAVQLVGSIEAANRNAKLMIEDAGAELVQKVDERIRFFIAAREVESRSFGGRDFHLGTDPIGRDVLSQMLHACRLSISIGLVSTGISVLIGIIIGSLMGYFGGWVDLVLSRVVEIFMAIPVLFLLIVAASVLPRNTYVMMAIIGCVTWTGSARFIRAEFLKLRNQDFVQSCRAVGLPLHSTLFRHMLPNGITPVLVQASFGIAAAIIAEATLSYLGLGPYGQSSWGKLLSLTTGETGVFLWWMAVFPGAAIFLTVLAYNILGENFRDAIDPKMRKAAH
ncbi:MAG: ABC transporter permease [Planctomycetota bacterium]|nr:ABC transporter permease [Planctomycetota bacterium]